MNDGCNGMVKQIICIKWGMKFGLEFVNWLYVMVVRNIMLLFWLYCFIDDGVGLYFDIVVWFLLEFEYQVLQCIKGKWLKF